MSSPALRRLFVQASRSSRRPSASARFGARRGMASDAHAAEKKSSDTPWLIGAGTVTALGAAYILSPPSKKPAHKAASAAMAPIEKALPPPEKETPAPEPVKDDEGTEADVSDSEKKSFDADSPKDAKASEESRFDDGAPGQTSAVHDEPKPEQKEKPASTKRTGSLQDDSDSGPTNMGDARQHAKSKNSPKEAEEATKQSSDSDS